jgi:hypothetical protein
LELAVERDGECHDERLARRVDRSVRQRVRRDGSRTFDRGDRVSCVVSWELRTVNRVSRAPGGSRWGSTSPFHASSDAGQSGVT